MEKKSEETVKPMEDSKKEERKEPVSPRDPWADLLFGSQSEAKMTQEVDQDKEVRPDDESKPTNSFSWL
ncbi:hypothetical protein ACM26V_06360 [Salipaludibacillus sp. HK11]|uniref:hypothetical protein n=1 Tax=Salipaludibacillus sp. HK11 TaxID=3394320 RepID=UPI0039FC6FF2